MIKRTLAITATVALLSTSALAYRNTTTDNSINPIANGGNASQGQVGINSLKNDILSKNKNNNTNNANSSSNSGAAAFSGSASKSGVKNSGNSESESGVYGSGNSANLNAQIDASRTKQKTDASSTTDVNVQGDVFEDAANVANAPIVMTPNSNFECTQVSGGGVQSTTSGIAANIASDSEACIAFKLVDAVKELEPRHKGLQMSMLCTSDQAREGLENHGEGLVEKYCKDRNTYLGVKPLLQGVKEIILLPITFIKFVINA